MRILVLHSRYASGEISGENRVVADEIELLRAGGHDVRSWTPEFDGRPVSAALRATWSQGAVRKVRSILERERPDVVHVHNLFPMISPAPLRMASRLGTPVVVTLHNFRLACLPATFLRDGVVCEDCLGRVPWRGVVRGCYRGSRAASASLGVAIATHRAFRTFDGVSVYAAVSDFVRRKYVAAGFDRTKFVVKPNFAPAAERRVGAGGSFLFAGRLSPEKGLADLLPALPAEAHLVVAGDGPERARLEAQAGANVEFTGPLRPNEVTRRLRAARAVVVPSTCYEAAPRVIAEAFAAGVPVVASAAGALPEFVRDGRNGLLVDPGDRDGWRVALTRLQRDEYSVELGDGAVRTWASAYEPGRALGLLQQIYERAVEHARTRAEGTA